jgi:hypothetical protein
MRTIVLVAFVVVVPAMAAAQQATTPPTIEKAIENAHMLFCMPLVGKEATNTSEVARWSGYQATSLPNFTGLKVRSAPAWLVPSASGRVVVSRGAVDERVPLSCEISVSDASGSKLGKKFSEMLVCNGCPFVRNEKASQEGNGIRMEKYDWKMSEKKALLSVVTFSLPPNPSGITFLVHTHMVH